jgi:hypothetical protein
MMPAMSSSPISRSTIFFGSYRSLKGTVLPGASSSMMTSFRSGQEGRIFSTISANDGWVTRTLACEFCRMYWASSALNWVLMGVSTAPAKAEPNIM